jgi:hypothetical protein
MSIDDIKRNDYCFTDGNGFISKGLAKCVAEKLSLCSKTSQQDVGFLYLSIKNFPNLKVFLFQRFFHLPIKFEWLVVKVFL